MTQQTRITEGLPEKLLSVDDLCKLLGVQRAAVDRARQKGLPFIKLPHSTRVYFNPSAVDAWIMSHQKHLA